MGRIKTALVKRTAIKLLQQYPDLFSADFEHNKKALDSLNLQISKKVRNMIAGYLVRLKKQNK